MKEFIIDNDKSTSLNDAASLVAASFRLIGALISFKEYLKEGQLPLEMFSEKDIDITIETLKSFHSFNINCLTGVCEAITREMQTMKEEKLH